MFFLVTACREKEVAHAQWDDIKDCKYTIRKKEFKYSNGAGWKVFRPKNHETRTIPLKSRTGRDVERTQEELGHQVDISNEQGDPEGHFSAEA